MEIDYQKYTESGTDDIRIGYGYHGDFITAWDVNFLQSAIKTCTSPSGRVEDCPLFTLQSESESMQCKLTPPKAIANEQCDGPQEGLCGGVQYPGGPASTKTENAAKLPADVAPIGPAPEPPLPVIDYDAAQLGLADHPEGDPLAPLPATEAPATPVMAMAVPPKPVVAAAAVVTPPPPPPPPVPIAPQHNCARTTQSVDGNIVYNICIMETTVTCDSPPTPAPLARRHVHQHVGRGHHHHK